MRRVICFVALALAVIVVTAGSAGACGGLVGENGTIQLTRTTTLAAYHDGVERYVTSFEFTGEGEEVGSIVPLPDVPTDVKRGGDWTLQRLTQEVAPPLEEDGLVRAQASTTAADVDILLETEIDALDITVLKGGGKEVGKWAVENGFLLTPDAPAKIVRPRAKLAVPVMPRWEGGTCASECCTDAVDRECRVHAGYTTV